MPYEGLLISCYLWEQSSGTNHHFLTIATEKEDNIKVFIFDLSARTPPKKKKGGSRKKIF
jgi:hypothetical protein